METCIANLVEPGDTALVGVKGFFGARMVEVAERAGARVVKVEPPWGEIIPEAGVIEAIRRERPKIVGIVHAETSTGVLQPVAGIGRAAREAGALFVLDCVTSLGGCPVEIDGWSVDAAYSGSQKCLGCPPGLSPATFSDRAVETVRTRRRRVQSWYMDISVAGTVLGAGACLPPYRADLA
jgi:alanine-glyoxylate transaminase/serine-glyoxylate transaminase/serine-pyruvate transaminase